MLAVLLIALSIVLGVLKLTGALAISWLLVALPFILLLVIWFVLLVVGAVIFHTISRSLFR